MSSYSTNLNFQTSRMTPVTMKKPTRGRSCAAVGEGLFTAVALEMDPGTRTFITLPVVPLEEKMSQE